MKASLLRFNGTVERDPAIDAWMGRHPDELGRIALQWFEVMRACGDEVRELMHDGCPVACLGDVPFGYVNVFTSHVNVGFFQGAALPDPARLLQGSGKCMRHVKLRQEQPPMPHLSPNSSRQRTRTSRLALKIVSSECRVYKLPVDSVPTLLRPAVIRRGGDRTHAV